jgi:hypothetical protein
MKRRRAEIANKTGISQLGPSPAALLTYDPRQRRAVERLAILLRASASREARASGRWRTGISPGKIKSRSDKFDFRGKNPSPEPKNRLKTIVFRSKAGTAGTSSIKSWYQFYQLEQLVAGLVPAVPAVPAIFGDVPRTQLNK